MHDLYFVFGGTINSAECLGIVYQTCTNYNYAGVRDHLSAVGQVKAHIVTECFAVHSFHGS